MSFKKNLLLSLLLASTFTCSFAQKKTKKDQLVTIETSEGVMHLVLFDQTPLHKANFLKLVDKKFYDDLLFHRVIDDFMIQGGDPDSKQAPAGTLLGKGDIGYTIPAEFSAALFHQKGALAAARNDNPEKASSGCQFYLVQGRKWTATELEFQQTRAARPFTEQQKTIYQNIGGTPHLDGSYTVFGQVIDGLAVIDRIAALPTGQRDRPEKNIAMKISSKKMSKRKIHRKYGYNYSN
ncbi:peptidyl-prolyl cis-trans isomerase B (cyclophilin B) [Dyadobacter jejuensis]|uniref:peptidylprolyl isomerase n=1 Tax=Dyadobacter jejuensis TaxID=1082580 RepID=A0A316APZ7_9BACT|nr:peptidylprolyl isomerase [Dyadobacter jejuensis]PWJ59558.1 peptidyl-prolyl cis-trans isomerase B (cyclophilin B) [Dyadobacter jejuensis]